MPKKSIVLFLFCSSLFIISNLVIFYPIFKSNNIIISFAIHPFNICNKYPKFWYYFKIFYVIILFISSSSISYILIKCLFKSKIETPNKSTQIQIQNLNLTVGYSSVQNQDIIRVEDFYTVPVGYKYVAVLTIDLDGNLTTFESHRIADSIEKAVVSKFKKIYKVIVHVNPVEE